MEVDGVESLLFRDDHLVLLVVPVAFFDIFDVLIVFDAVVHPAVDDVVVDAAVVHPAFDDAVVDAVVFADSDVVVVVAASASASADFPSRIAVRSVVAFRSICGLCFMFIFVNEISKCSKLCVQYVLERGQIEFSFYKFMKRMTYKLYVTIFLVYVNHISVPKIVSLDNLSSFLSTYTTST